MLANDSHLAYLDAQIHHLSHVGQRSARDGSAFELDRIDDSDWREGRASHFPDDVDDFRDGSFEFRLESHVALRSLALTVFTVDDVGLDDDAVAVELDFAVSDAGAKIFAEFVSLREQIDAFDGEVRRDFEALLFEPSHELSLSLEVTIVHHVVADSVNELACSTEVRRAAA